MIYTIGYYIAVIGLVIMMFGFKSFYSQMNKWSRVWFVFFCFWHAITKIYFFFVCVLNRFFKKI